jgi:hypothetical protein
MKTNALVVTLILAILVPSLAAGTIGNGTSFAYEKTSITPHGIIRENVSSDESFSQTVPSVAQAGAFRIAPVVKVRPVNDVVEKGTPGLVEFYFSNPTLNDISLTADVYVSVPSGLHVSGEGFSAGGAAGDVHGNFIVPPGSDRTVYMDVVGEKTGQYIVHAEVMYYPQNDKDNYQQLSLTHPFTVATGTPDLNNELGLTWIILVVVLLGGVAIIYAVRRRSVVKIEED